MSQTYSQGRAMGKVYVESKKERFLSMLRACVVLAGGREMSNYDLKAMPLSEIIDMTFYNNITLNVSLDKVQRP